jgi:polysaccharide export outer membrane protein
MGGVSEGRNDVSFLSRWRFLLPVIVACAAVAGFAGCTPSYTSVVNPGPQPGGGILPAAPKPLAVLGPGDELEVFVWGYQELSRRAPVNYTGTLSYPLIGQVPASGKTVEDVEQFIRAGLSDYIRDPVVKVSVASVRPHKFLVLGEVKRPGVYAMSVPNMRLLEGIGQAGGFTEDARQKEVLILREVDNTVFVQPIDVRKIPAEGKIGDNVVLAEGDIVYVPTLAMADAARHARRFVEILSPLLSAQYLFLNFQSSTLLWDEFVEALKGGPITVEQIIVEPQQ